MVYVKW